MRCVETHPTHMQPDLHDFMFCFGFGQKQNQTFLPLQWYFDLSKQKVLLLPKSKQNRAGQHATVASASLGLILTRMQLASAHAFTALRTDSSSPLGATYRCLCTMRLRRNA